MLFTADNKTLPSTLLTHLPIPDQVACDLLRDPAWTLSIVNNPACHAAIRPLLTPADRKQITTSAYYRGLTGGNAATLDLYLNTRRRHLYTATVILTDWTLNETDQARFAQNNLPLSLLPRTFRDPYLAPQAKIEAARQPAERARFGKDNIDRNLQQQQQQQQQQQSAGQQDGTDSEPHKPDPATPGGSSRYTPHSIWTAIRKRTPQTQRVQIAPSPVVNWTAYQHVYCGYTQQHQCQEPFEEFGDTLRNAFGTDTNQWRMFLGLVNSCTTPDITFQQLIDTTLQLTRPHQALTTQVPRSNRPEI